MNLKKVNKKLEDLYKEKYDNELKRLEKINSKITVIKEKATNPLLLRANSEYIEADYRVMIFGQETNNWSGEVNNGILGRNVNDLLDLYESFYLEGGCFAYGGQFWNGYARFREMLNIKLKKYRVGYLWNNVVKIGKCGKGFPDYTYDSFTKDNFNKIILNEIDILKPDIILFLSGPNYDVILKDIFDDVNFSSIKGFTERQLSKVTIDGKNNIFRTYHPNYLWRNDIDKYYQAIIKNIVLKD